MSVENDSKSYLKTEVDSDAIKMFVGQIPRNWDETDCIKLLEEFGPIHQLNILKDKNSAVSKGDLIKYLTLAISDNFLYNVCQATRLGLNIYQKDV